MEGSIFLCLVERALPSLVPGNRNATAAPPPFCVLQRLAKSSVAVASGRSGLIFAINQISNYDPSQVDLGCIGPLAKNIQKYHVAPMKSD